ncbi:hypothetical protein AB4Y90_07870 [Chryseobacterium sp. 2TAF14]|uniref:hypothetical protein n=1 Tax=Chryseobacterium sp. 2TAF14 TaxID=3233007 RepID=UPI003F90B95B
MKTMQKLRDKIEHHVLKAEVYWKALSVQKDGISIKPAEKAPEQNEIVELSH